MDDGRLWGREGLPIDADELGEIRGVESECPGVYFVAVGPEAEPGGFQALEGYYQALDGVPISQEALKYGTPLRNGQAVAFRLGQEDGGAKIVEYEILKYKVAHGLPLPPGETLHEFSIFAAELYPEYFGTLPAPALTPWGYTARYRTLENGIYWIETDRCLEVLAVCYPAWTTEFSDGVLGRSRMADYDAERGIDETLGYRFFSKEDSCVAVFELLQTRPEWVEAGRVDLPALMNAILEYRPEYAVSHNLYEQSGLNDAMAMLLRAMGVDVEPEGFVERMIALTPGAGTDFLRW